MVTVRAAEALGVEGLATLEAGAPADLLIFRRDPTRSVEALGSLEAVVSAGVLYTRADLDASIERFLEHYSSWPVGPLSSFFARRALKKAASNFDR